MDISSRNGYHSGGGSPGPVNQRRTAYDAAIAAATPAEKERLQSIRLQLDIPPNSPEWQFYAILAPLLTNGTERGDLGAQLERIESRLKKKIPEPIVPSPMRDLITFAIAMLVCVAVAVLMGVSPAPAYALIAAFALGLCVALAYVWFAPMVSRRR